MTTHQSSHKKEYKAWQRMKACCTNPKVPYYKKYGGKGISICPEWKENFSQFLIDMKDMPPQCNGLVLIDETKDFNKYNCKWIQKTAGRPKLPEQDKKKKRNRNIIKNPKSICLVLEKDHLDFIKRQALQLSVQKGIYVEPNQLIREALQRAFPAPKQYDMFGDPQ